LRDFDLALLVPIDNNDDVVIVNEIVDGDDGDGDNGDDNDDTSNLSLTAPTPKPRPRPPLLDDLSSHLTIS